MLTPEIAESLLNECLPLSVEKAKALGMIDEVYTHEYYYEELHSFAKNAYDDDFIWEKQEYLEEHREQIEALKEKELEIMYPEFWKSQSVFHILRQEFVYKVCPRDTPVRLRKQSEEKHNA